MNHQTCRQALAGRFFLFLRFFADHSENQDYSKSAGSLFVLPGIHPPFRADRASA
jgi:hypothetical protein